MVFSEKGFTEIHIAETNGLRRNMLSKIGDFIAYDPREGIPDLGHIDIVLDAVGSGPTRAAASAMVRPGGVISHIGLQDNEPGPDTAPHLAANCIYWLILLQQAGFCRGGSLA